MASPSVRASIEATPRKQKDLAFVHLLPGDK